MREATQYLLCHGNSILFVVVFAEQAGVPLPGAPWLLAAGALGGGGGLNMVSAIGSTVLACIMADSFWFYVGQRGGQRVFRLFARLRLAQYLPAQPAVERSALRGLRRLIVAKFLPLGTLLPPLAGALGVSPLRFFLLDGLSSTFYATFYILIGFIFRNRLRQFSAVLQKLGIAAFLLIATLVAAYVAWTLVRRRQVQKGRAEKQHNGSPSIVSPSLSPRPR